jgi:anti-sigma factor ChrR (cupin superfamily)
MSAHVDDRLFDLALGTLPAEERPEVEAHLDGCERCTGELAEMVEALSAMPLALDPVAPPPALRARILETVAVRERRLGFAERVARLLDVTLEGARAMLDDLLDPRSWTPGFVDGMQLVHVRGGPRVANAITGFVRMAPGVVFPPHRHVGEEDTLCLQGSYRDSDGTIYGVGTITHMGPGSEHHFEALPGEDLIYVAVVQEGLQVGDQILLPDDPRA